MDRLESMGVFVAVAEAASFTGAARRLGLSPPAVTRAVARTWQIYCPQRCGGSTLWGVWIWAAKVSS